MKQRSRTEYSLINMFTGFIGYGLNTIIGFVCRIIFVRTLSAEYLGVSGLFTNILSVLSLAELGISSAIIYALYKPIAEENHKKIASIMQFYRKAYAAIGTFVGIVGLAIMPFLDYLITSNGAITYDLHTGQVVCSTLMSNSESVEIFNILKDYNLIYEIYFDGDCYMNNESYAMFDGEHVSPHIHDLLKDLIKPVSSLEEFIDGKGIEKLNILSLTAEERIELEEKISNNCDVAFASSFPIVKGKNGNLEMTHEKATKGFAIEGLCKAMGIDGTNVMCFGDGENDCSMLSFADHSFAMANGTDLVKSTAKYITDTNDNGGVAKAINKYVFGE